MTSNETSRPYTSPYDPEPKVIYTFSSLEYFDDLMEGSLWFAPTRTYNDIHESTIFARPDEIGDSESVFKAEALIKAWLNSQVVKCFTLDPLNPLMWAHYADNHKGICVGYKLENFKNSFDYIPIRYSSSPPLSVVSSNPTTEQIYLLALDTLMTKSLDWAYEKEFRVYMKNSEISEKGGGLIYIGPDAIVDVFFGHHVNQETIGKCRTKIPDGIAMHVAEIDDRALSYNIPFRTL